MHLKLFCSLILLTVTIIIKREVVKEVNLPTAIDAVLGKIFDNDISLCMLLVPDKPGWLSQKILEHFHLYRVDFNATLEYRHLAKLFTKNVKCLASFSTYKNIGNILRITRNVDNHVTLYTDSKAPEDKIIQNINRPLVVINQRRTKDLFSYDVYCPKVGKPKIISPVSVGFCSKRCCSQKCFLTTIAALCSNPFRGQNIIMAQPVSMPNFLLPQMGFNTGQRPISGGLYNLFATAGQYFGFQPQFKFDIAGGDYVPENNTFTPGKYLSVINEDAEVTAGAILPIFSPMFHFTYPYIQGKLVYLSRPPQPVKSFSHIVRPFHWKVWMTMVLTFLLLAVLQLVVYLMYQKPFIKIYELTKPRQPWFNFFLFSMCKLTEPDTLPWFTKWSAGKFLTALWTLLSLFFVLFYMSNLRANLMTIRFEEPPSTLKHVAIRKERVYIFDTAVDLRREYLEATGQAGSVKHEIALLAEESGGIFNLDGGLPQYAPEDLALNGAFILMEDLSIPYLYITYPRLRMEAMYVVDEPTSTYFRTMMVKKHSPATRSLNHISRLCIDTGLIRKWFQEHLSLRSILKPQTERTKLQALPLTSYYLTGMLYACAVVISSIVFYFEIATGVKESPLKLMADIVTKRHMLDLHT